MDVTGVRRDIAPGLLIGPLKRERSDSPSAQLCKVHLPALYPIRDAPAGERPRLPLVDTQVDEPLRGLFQYGQHRIEVACSSLYYSDLTVRSLQLPNNVLEFHRRERRGDRVRQECRLPDSVSCR